MIVAPSLRMLRKILSPSRRPYHRRWWRLSLRRALLVLLPLLAALLEVWSHVRTYSVGLPEYEQDEPFATACREPNVDGPREKAALVMLARNKELKDVLATIESIERHFNRWFHYPVVFLNDEPWSDDFVAATNASCSGGATYHVIPKGDWGFPSWIDPNSARASIARQGKKGILYAGLETYHNMCRFYSQ